MKVVLTGGFGSGKSTVAGLLKRKGAEVVDSDAVVHALYAKDAVVRGKIRRAFGHRAFGPDGAVDRRHLAEQVFADPEKRLLIEKILHPAVRREIRRRKTATRARLFVADIPLYYETGWKEKFDAVIVVQAGLARRLERLRKRGFSQAEARRRIKAQIPLSTKAARADFVIDNNGSIAQTRKQINDIWKRLTIHHEVVRGTNGLAERK